MAYRRFHACGRSDAQRSGMARADSRADDASARLDESERRAFSAWMDSRWRKATGTFGRFALRFDPVRASIASFVLQEDGAAGGRVTPFRLLDDDGLGLPASEWGGRMTCVYQG